MSRERELVLVGLDRRSVTDELTYMTSVTYLDGLPRQLVCPPSVVAVGAYRVLHVLHFHVVEVLA